MYSQNNEEQVILEHFGGKPESSGRFLDIGAYNGKTFSNTLALIERGWSGVCVEPSPSVFVDLLKLHGSNPQIRLLNAAITLSGGLSKFWDSDGDAISSTVEAHAVKCTAGYGTHYTEYDVFTMPLFQLFEVYGYNFNFINLDVEGCSYQLFTGLPFDRLTKTTCLCVEHDGHFAEIVQLTTPLGFRLLTCNAENVILGR